MTARWRAPLLACLLALPLASVAASLPDPDRFFVDDNISLTQCGEGEVRALRVFRVGTARLLRARCDGEASPPEAPLSLQFQYRRDVPGDAFGKAAEAMLQRNMATADFEALLPRLQAFNSHYQDIGDGDRYQLDYHPDGRLLLSLNGKPLVQEEGHEFARAYLLVWFGERPYSAALKRALLGR